MNANCTNRVGGHNCTCKEGFVGDGRSCSGNRIDFAPKAELISVVSQLMPALNVLCNVLFLL